MSSVLSSLKLISAKRQTSIDPIQSRRQRVSLKLQEQLALATALQNGETYTVKRQRNVRDKETGVTQTIEVTKKVKQWWFVSQDTKSVSLQLRYGSRVIEFAKGKNAIEVNDGNELITTIKKLSDAVLSGELDIQIEQAANIVKSRFKK